MNKIDKVLLRLKKEGSMGLMTHVVVGYPSLKKTIEIVKVMAEAGADFIELQIPFSDPIADGPTIMKACESSLKRGIKVRDALAVAKILTGKISTPILFMAYYNTVFKYGVKKFCRKVSLAGISGLIVPDMPLEEEAREHFTFYAEENNLHVIRVVSPASTQERLRKNAEVSRGFVYCSARQGITGARKDLAPELVSYLKKSKQAFDCPIAVGFGISKQEHVKKIAEYADIVVVGSAIVDIINHSTSESLLSNIRRFIQTLKR